MSPFGIEVTYLEHDFSDEHQHLTDQTHNFSKPDITHAVPNSAPGTPNKWARPIWEVPPRNEKMPPLKDFRLTKELVQQRVKDNIVIVTFGNYAFMDFILNWVKHLTDLGLSNVLVGKLCSFYPAI